jgi:hypothetical protein
MAGCYLENNKKTEALITGRETNGSDGDHMVAAKKQENSWNIESGLDVLMLLLYSEGTTGKIGEPLEGITRLDKIMYLLSQSKEFSSIVQENYEFQADNFGPFAPELTFMQD